MPRKKLIQKTTKAKAQRALPVDPEIRAGTLGALIEIYENQPDALTVGDADAVLRFADVVRRRLDKSLERHVTHDSPMPNAREGRLWE